MPVKLQEGTDITETFAVLVDVPELSYPANLNNGLVSFWNFNEGRGNTAYDKNGTNNLAITGATWIAGKAGSGLYFDGVDDIAVVNPFTGLVDTSEFTLTFWIKIKSYSTILYKGYVHFQLDSNSRITFENTSVNGQYGFTGREAGATKDTPINVVLSLDTWYFICFATSVSAGRRRSYVNGELSGEVMGSINISSPFLFRISAGNLSDGKFLIDEVRIYNRYLNADEVKLLYQLGRQKLELGQDPTNMSLQP